MVKSFFADLIDLILPPRPTERVVRSLSIEILQSLGGEELLPYHDPRVTALVWELKYHGTSRSAALAGEYMADVLLAAASEELGVPLLVPVPMHPARRRERGHNQTELLCESALRFLLKSTGQKVLGSPVSTKTAEAGRPDFLSGTFAPLEYAPKVLVRTINTKTQQGLPRTERLKNVKNSMQAVQPERVEGRVCIVVDDVTTTGATFEEAKRALRQAGARAVQCIALARS